MNNSTACNQQIETGPESGQVLTESIKTTLMPNLEGSQCGGPETEDNEREIEPRKTDVRRYDDPNSPRQKKEQHYNSPRDWPNDSSSCH